MSRTPILSLVLIAILAVPGSSALRAQCEYWNSVGSGLGDDTYALAVFDDGTGPALYAGGNFTTAGGVSAWGIAKWNGATWAPLGSGLHIQGLGMGSPYPYALAVWDDGNGPALYVGGGFNRAGGLPANNIAKWDGATWSALGSGLSSSVNALAVFDDGTGPVLYVGGDFNMAGGLPANHIAKWDGTTWSPLGSGLDDEVEALALFDDGNGPDLYVGGSFSTAGGSSASCIARWDGTAWSSLGSGLVTLPGSWAPAVYALGVYDDATGPALYATGRFDSAGGIPAKHIARWDGVSWSPLGNGLVQNFATGFDLAVHQDATGSALFVTGQFSQLHLAPGNRIARWDGSTWSALGTGVGLFGINRGRALTVFDDGTGPSLYAGGEFSHAGGIVASHIARWSSGQRLWQTNSAVASLDYAGVQALCLGPGATSVHTTEGMTVNLSSSQPVGTPYDLLLNFAPIIPASHPGAIVTPQGQIVNIDFFHPSTAFLSSGSLAPAVLPFPGNLSFPFALPSPGTLSAQMVVIDVTQPEPFVLSQACQADFGPCALLEDFDSANPGDPLTYPPGWVDGGGDFMWRVHTGSVASSTGPSGDHTSGSGNYIYCETGPAGTLSTFIIEAPPAPLATLTNPTCTFWYHMYGYTMGTLQLQEWNGASWTTIWMLSGDQGNSWQQASVPLTGGGTTALRLHYTSSSNPVPSLDKAAIDDFQICE